MFGWLKKKSLPEILYFKSNDAAFEYAARYMQRPLMEGAVIFGQVVRKVEAESSTGLLRSSQEKWRVRLATEHGVLETDHCGSIAEGLATGLKLKTSAVNPGDLVGIQVAAYDPKYSINSPMQYFIIMCKVKPAVRVADHVFLPDVER